MQDFRPWNCAARPRPGLLQSLDQPIRFGDVNAARVGADNVRVLDADLATALAACQNVHCSFQDAFVLLLLWAS